MDTQHIDVVTKTGRVKNSMLPFGPVARELQTLPGNREHQMLTTQFIYCAVMPHTGISALTVCECVCSVAQLSLTLGNPMDCSRPGSSLSMRFLRQE